MVNSSRGETWPHYPLERVKDQVAKAGIGAFSRTALDGGAQMGLLSAEMLATVLSLERSMFYKSMTTYQDHRVWQDAYHVPTPLGVASVKFTLRADGAMVISFKRL